MSTILGVIIVELDTLRQECYTLQIATFRTDSRFYRQDCEDLAKHLRTRTDAEVRETISRFRWKPTAKQIRDACQFDGLPVIKPSRRQK